MIKSRKYFVQLILLGCTILMVYNGISLFNLRNKHRQLSTNFSKYVQYSEIQICNNLMKTEWNKVELNKGLYLFVPQFACQTCIYKICDDLNNSTEITFVVGSRSNSNFFNGKQTLILSEDKWIKSDSDTPFIIMIDRNSEIESIYIYNSEFHVDFINKVNMLIGKGKLFL